MITELLARGQHAIMEHLPFHKNLPTEDVIAEPEFSLAGRFEREDPSDAIVDLQEGDSAQWAAGLLYAYSKQTNDSRDYIVGCSVQVDKLDKRLARAYKKYGKGQSHRGNWLISMTEDLFRESMAACDDTNPDFEELAEQAHDFFAQENWNEIASANYQANKALADHQWGLGLNSWERGVYFDAAMFYGRCWNLLMTGSII